MRSARDEQPRQGISRLALAAVIVIALLATAPTATRASSDIILPVPTSFGDVSAGTYDELGERVGSAKLSLRRLSDGLLRLLVVSGVDGGAHTAAEADLQLLEGGRGLRVLREQSQSYDASGRSLGLLQIDHESGEASCGPPEDSNVATTRVSLPEKDRVANVPLHLLFLPLVRKRVDRVDFQLFLCRHGPRFVNFRATVAEHKNGGVNDIIEVRYRPEFGRLISFVAAALTPNLSFWYDANAGGSYLAHRMPLFTKGPEVLVIRDGVEHAVLPLRP